MVLAFEVGDDSEELVRTKKKGDEQGHRRRIYLLEALYTNSTEKEMIRTYGLRYYYNSISSARLFVPYNAEDDTDLPDQLVSPDDQSIKQQILQQYEIKPYWLVKQTQST